MLLADELRHLYNEKTKKLSLEILSDSLKDMRVFEKELDEPLPWWKKAIANIAFMKTKHVFAVFSLKNTGIMGSVDFYNTD